MMILHGVAGGLDEVLIAVAALGVLWLAVKLAGRKPAGEQDEQARRDTPGEPERTDGSPSARVGE